MSFQFALSPSDFSSSEVPEEEREEAASRGVRIIYSFPWGPEPLETLWSRGNTELLQTHKGVRSKLQVSLLIDFFKCLHVDTGFLFVCFFFCPLSVSYRSSWCY